MARTAVIIKGNPVWLDVYPIESKAFYSQLSEILAEAGFHVLFDDGLPYTSPPAADLWIGHSRGIDRLRFAPEGTSTFAVDDHLDRDHLDAHGRPTASHWIVTTRLRDAIRNHTGQITPTDTHGTLGE